MASLFFYISGHGFGHASRQIEIINATGAMAPSLSLVVRTSAPRWLFERTARVPLTFVDGECDTGVVQIDSLTLDERATIRRAAAFHESLPARARAEAALLAEHDARLVLCDAPPLACAAAAAAGLPAIVVANFTWDWIYQEYAEHLKEAPPLLPTIADAYRQAVEAWRLPMHGGFESVRSVQDVPFVARHAGHSPAAVRRALALPSARPLVLFSFGGLGTRDVDLTRIDCLDEFALVLTYRDARPPDHEGVHAVREADLYARGLRYEDLVAAVDVVLTKPGYGIISECIANDTAILYTSRGRFREYEVLVADMPRYLRAQFIAQEDVFAGRWRAPLRELAARPPVLARPATDGARVIAARILELLQ